MSGKLFAIGTGPGAADLITVRAAKALGKVDIVYAPAGKKDEDSLALSIVRGYIAEETEIKERHFPMSHDSAEKQAAWDAVTKEIVHDVEAGRQVAFVSLGDVMLYSTWVSILQGLPPALALEIIPGITSFSLIAAKTRTPLAMETQSLLVMPCTAPQGELEQALRQHPSLVLMKVARRFEKVRELIAKQGLLDCSVLVSNASLQGEMQCRALETIDAAEKLSYFTTILINKAWQQPR